MERELLKGNTPALILAVLGSGSLHGYAIAREIERKSGEVLKFKEGTLYPALHALERDGFISGQWQPSASGPARRVYKLSAKGRRELARRAAIWKGFAQAVNHVLEGA